MHGNRICIASAALATAVLATALPAAAANYDGQWSMVAVTTRGHCGSVDIGVAISHGRLHATSGFFAFYPIDLTGRVTPSGALRMTAIAGPRTAHGTGRLGRTQGSGTWSGTGPSGRCSGHWRISR